MDNITQEARWHSGIMSELWLDKGIIEDISNTMHSILEWKDVPKLALVQLHKHMWKPHFYLNTWTDIEQCLVNAETPLKH